MAALSEDMMVGRIVAEWPRAARVMERLGIDYCCRGRKALGEACTERSLDALEVMEEIVHEPAGEGEERDWSRASMSELADHIEGTHHTYLRRELPRLVEIARKVAGAHGERQPELVELAHVVEVFAAEMWSHMRKEERVLFPALRRMEKEETPKASGEHGPEDGSAARGIEEPIRAMMAEHDEAGRALERMRRLTDGFRVPAGACPTWKVLAAGLAELEQDMHRHVHKENNILFPSAREVVAKAS